MGPGAGHQRGVPCPEAALGSGVSVPRETEERSRFHSPIPFGGCLHCRAFSIACQELMYCQDSICIASVV